MACNIVISSFAHEEENEAYEWYELQRTGLGEELLIELETADKRIAEHPEFYGFIDGKKDLRDYLVRRFPFLIVYRVNGAIVEIIAVHHAKKHPIKKYGSTG